MNPPFSRLPRPSDVAREVKSVIYEWSSREPHSHLHRHTALTRKHPHYPDVHHRHGH